MRKITPGEWALFVLWIVIAGVVDHDRREHRRGVAALRMEISAVQTRVYWVNATGQPSCGKSAGGAVNTSDGMIWWEARADGTCHDADAPKDPK